MNKENQHKAWQRHDDHQGIAWLALDAPASTNTLTDDVLSTLSQELDNLETNPPRAVVFYSAKASGFIAGADINRFRETMSENEVYQHIREVQTLFSRIESLPCPTLAMIHGFCLGGGLEMALACDYRIACDDDNTRIGLPEIMLGIHPGYGGSVRLIEKLGVIHAMPLMLSGRLLSARSAYKAGIIDEVVADRQLHRAASVRLLAAEKPRQPAWWQRLLSSAPLRPAVAALLRRQMLKRLNPAHYPAPLALIKLWQKQPRQRDNYFAAEARSVAQLLLSDTAQHLIRLFFLRNRLKAFGKKADFPVAHVHIIGAGVMGGDIAAWCALQGCRVTLQDQSPDSIAPAVKRAAKLFQAKLKVPHKVQAAMDRLIPDCPGHGVRQAEIVIEAIFEDLTAKQALYREIEPQMRADALLATNTSSLSLESLTSCLEQPERLVGLHFFNPVARMQLVEVVVGSQTDSRWVDFATAFVRQIDRLPLPVKSAPGFLINRILMPYLLEAVEMAQQGIAIQPIDKAATDFGMPMGPIELADTVGLDICHSVAGILAAELGMPMPGGLQQLLEQGRLGKKTGHGFYRYDARQHAIKHRESKPDNTPLSVIQKRLMLRLYNECAACLDEGIVADADLLDAGMIFGTGFAPFRGGPMQVIQQQGAATLQSELQDFSQQFGERFAPQPGWRALS
jgi:3-hydroxyacyl-CoA dehydrogenase/enoyl-CoA hydratase/3-hydroxybutyryl-CoA epimerase